MKKAVSIFIALFAAWSLLASEPKIRVEVHNLVELSEQFNLVFVVEGENAPNKFEWEVGEDFTLVWGPQKGTSTSISIVNGSTTRSSQTSYTYILQPKKTGSFAIAAAKATFAKGKEAHSSPVTIRVVDNGSKQSSQPSSQSRSAESSGQESEGELALRLTLSRNSVVVGEPITASLKIYSRSSLAGVENARFPSFGGFWSSETESPQNLNFQREEYEGKVWDAALLRRWVIIPQKAGELTIDPAELMCLVNVRRRRNISSPIDDFFGTDYSTVRKRIYTTSPTVHVAALPQGAPASFSGGVGEYSIKASVSRDSLMAHDAGALTLSVSGKGNIALLEAPKINFPPDFEAYDVKVNTSGGATFGTKTFEYPFIPRSAGDFTIGPIKYSYYDTRTRQYKTLVSDSLRVHVSRNPASGAAPSGPSDGGLIVERKGVKNLSEDIRFIHTKANLHGEDSLFVNSKGYWTLVLGLTIAALLLWAGLVKVESRRKDVEGRRRGGAARAAMKRLSKAKQYLEDNLYSAFYEELHRALLGYVSDRLSLDAAAQSKESIYESLSEGSISKDTASKFVELLDALEFARYSPDGGQGAMQTHYKEAMELITEIDSVMKKNNKSGAGAAKLAVILLMLTPAASLHAAGDFPDSLWQSGVNAYMEENYPQAIKDWEGVRGCSLVSAPLYYNLGNAHFKAGELAPAILWYERALREDPSDADIKHNLEYARALTQDRIEEIPEFFLEAWGRAARNILPSNTWAWLSIVFWAAALGMFILFRLGGSAGKRRLGFFTAIAAALLALLSWDFSQWQKSDAERRDGAIVMKTVTPVKSSPSEDSGKDLFILHEGTKVKLLDSVGNYSSIELADGRRGWLLSRDIEII